MADSPSAPTPPRLPEQAAEQPRAHFTPLTDAERAAIHAQAQPRTDAAPNNPSRRHWPAWAILLILALLALWLAMYGG